MKKAKPICQMTLLTNRNNQLGVVFSSELINDHSQAILFCIPIYYTLNETTKLNEYLQKKDLYIPFHKDGEQVNLYGQLNFPSIEFNLNKFNIDKKITFTIETNLDIHKDGNRLFSSNSKKGIFNKIKEILSRFSKYTDTEFLTLNYIGKWNKIDNANTKFLVISPTNFDTLDELYQRYRIIPIGLTPKFGKILGNLKYI